MSSADRRRGPRLQKLITLTFEHSERQETCVTVNVGPCGAWVSTRVGLSLPVGGDVALCYQPAGAASAPMTLRGRVLRTVSREPGDGRHPGMAVEFESVVTSAPREELHAFLVSVLGMECTLDGLLEVAPSGEKVYRFPEYTEGVVRFGKARHVHRARLAPERCLPSDAKAGEDVQREIQSDVERRRSPRHAVRVDVTYYVGDMPHSAAVLNVSRSGMFLQTDHDPPPPGARIWLRFPVTSEPEGWTVKIDATVRRRWEPAAEVLPGFAVKIREVDEQGRTGSFRMYLHRLKNPTRKARGRGYHYSSHR